MDLRERVISIYSSAMKKDHNIDLTIKLAFEKIVNSNQRTALALVTYLDEAFKKDFKLMNEAEMSERIDKIIYIFRYLDDKDKFESFYKNSFAKRLLDSRQINDDAERILVSKLKEECGFTFTNSLETMFKDMKNSQELNTEYKTTVVGARKVTNCDVNIKVLTAGDWPIDGKENIPSSLPKSIS